MYTHSFLLPQNQSTKDNEKIAEITFLLFGRWKVTNKIIFNKEFQLNFKKETPWKDGFSCQIGVGTEQQYLEY